MQNDETINRLLKLARTAKNVQGMNILSFVDYDPEKKYTASVNVWNGVSGNSGKQYYSEHESPEDAESFCEDIINRYPEAKSINFIIDDLMFPQEK